MKKIAPTALLGSLISLLSFQSFTPSDLPVLQYIDQYKPIAISEMHRTGIPASITLAQGIVESRYGTSVLSTETNNHFGIKCKEDWEGKTFYFKDDDFRDGKLVDSCFRGYDDPVQSYYDHSDFLLDNPRYESLFQLPKTDYKGWAKGLKNCGYATDRHYAKTLIQTIEEYQLYRYDRRPVELVQQVVNISESPVKTQELAAKPVTTPPKVFALPSGYQRGEGAKNAAIAERRAFQDAVFRGKKTYLFEAVPNVEQIADK